MFGIRLPRALTAAFIDEALKTSRGCWPLCRHAGSDCGANRRDDSGRRDRPDMRRWRGASAACSRLMTIPGVRPTDRARLCGRNRRSFAHPSIARCPALYLGLVPRRYQSGEVDYVGGISKCGDRRVRTLLYEAANVMLTRYKGKLKLKDWSAADRQAVNDAQGPGRSGSPPRDHYARNAARRD